MIQGRLERAAGREEEAAGLDLVPCLVPDTTPSSRAGSEKNLLILMTLRFHICKMKAITSPSKGCYDRIKTVSSHIIFKKDLRIFKFHILKKNT